MLVARGILRLRKGAKGPAGESYLSNFLDSASLLEMGLVFMGVLFPALRSPLDLRYAPERRWSSRRVGHTIALSERLAIFKKYSRMKLQMQREALSKLNRHANETADPMAQQVPETRGFCRSSGTVRAKNEPSGGFASRKRFRINQAPVAQLDRASAF